MNSFKYRKSVQALNFFACREGGVINYMKAIKLVWAADRLHIRLYGRTITNDDYVAMKYGLVASGTKDIIYKSSFFEKDVVDYANQFLSEADDYAFTSLSDVDQKVFSKTDLKALDQVYNTFKGLDKYQLAEYTHNFPEWQRFESELSHGKGKAFQVNEEDFFKNGLTTEVFNQSSELLQLSLEHHLHSKNITLI